MRPGSIQNRKNPPAKPVGPGEASRSPDPRVMSRRLARWFEQAARDLPWRTRPPGSRDPYITLVSEIMLQQTQASRVAERLPGFLARFPTLDDLAKASEDEVLASWSGLGYYRRARLLRACAVAVTERHSGRAPADLASLRALPGLGGYTAGAIASLSFDLPAIAIDANIRRVLARVLGMRTDPARAPGSGAIESFAQKLLDASPVGPGAHNEALIELGALVCKPRSPDCGVCPLAGHCVAHREDCAAEIPLRVSAKARKPIYCLCAVITAPGGQVLIEQRAPEGLWASMWQTPTIESGEDVFPFDALSRSLGLRSAQVLRLRKSPLQTFRHLTTHREVIFRIATLHLKSTSPRAGRVWVNCADLGGYALSTPQRRIISSTLRGDRPP